MQPVTLTVLLGGASTLVLPGRDPAAEPATPHFPPPEVAPSLPVEPLGGSDGAQRRLAVDVAVGRRKLTDHYVFFPAVRLPDGTEYVEKFIDEFSIEDDKPLSATVICRRSIAISRATWQTRVEAVSTMTGDERWFHVTNELAAYEDPHVSSRELGRADTKGSFSEARVPCRLASVGAARLRTGQRTRSESMDSGLPESSRCRGSRHDHAGRARSCRCGLCIEGSRQH